MSRKVIFRNTAVADVIPLIELQKRVYPTIPLCDKMREVCGNPVEIVTARGSSART